MIITVSTGPRPMLQNMAHHALMAQGMIPRSEVENHCCNQRTWRREFVMSAFPPNNGHSSPDLLLRAYEPMPRVRSLVTNQICTNFYRAARVGPELRTRHNITRGYRWGENAVKLALREPCHRSFAYRCPTCFLAAFGRLPPLRRRWASALSPTATPILNVDIWSSRISFGTTRLRTSTGIAYPIPTLEPDGEKSAVFTPINRPPELSKGPPELPGLIAASVWITLVASNPLRSEMRRLSPLMIPDVSV